MEPANAIKMGLSQFYRFSGRTPRREFAPFVAFAIFIVLTVGFFDGVAGFVVLAVLALPLLSSLSRRFNDIGLNGKRIVIVMCTAQALLSLPALVSALATPFSKSWFQYLVVAALVANLMAVLTACFKTSHSGPNIYGPNPNEVPS